MRLHKYLALGLLLLAGGSAQAKQYCGELANHYGPFDYRLRGQVNLEIVERAHFTENVEQGISGSTSYLGDDLDYTLRAIPNHHRALATLTRLALRSKAIKIEHMKRPVECYFERAQRFQPDDAKVHALYGNYLMAVGREGDARKAYDRALALEPDNASILYNLGLLALRAKEYDKAAAYAEKAYGLDFPMQFLKTKLQAAGKWTDSNEQAVQAARTAAAEAAQASAADAAPPKSE